MAGLFSTIHERDRELAAYLSDMCYVRDLGFSRGSYLMNGFMHIFEDHRNFLPLSAGALKAWERQQTIQEGEPIPFQAMGLII